MTSRQEIQIRNCFLSNRKIFSKKNLHRIIDGIVNLASTCNLDLELQYLKPPSLFVRGMKSIFLDTEKRGCTKFGGACFGAHGKRSSIIDAINSKIAEDKRGCSQFGGSCFGAHGKRTIPEQETEVKRGCSQFGGSCFGAHGKRTLQEDPEGNTQVKRGCSQFGGSCFGAHGKRASDYNAKLKELLKRGCSQFGGSCFGAHGKRSQDFRDLYALLRQNSPAENDEDGEYNSREIMNFISPYFRNWVS